MAIHLKTLGLKFGKYREQLCETHKVAVLSHRLFYQAAKPNRRRSIFRSSTLSVVGRVPRELPRPPPHLNEKRTIPSISDLLDARDFFLPNFSPKATDKKKASAAAGLSH